MVTIEHSMVALLERINKRRTRKWNKFMKGNKYIIYCRLCFNTGNETITQSREYLRVIDDSSLVK